MSTGLNEIATRELRNALGSFGTGVTVVTACLPGGRRVGITANSFSSVSLEPPIVLWSLVSTSPSLEVFDAAARFVINVLSVDQIDLARRFASRAVDKFEGIACSTGLEGLPVLEHCSATIECRTVQRSVVGDHVLFLGAVERFHYHPVTPLMFCQGCYVQGTALPGAIPIPVPAARLPAEESR